eukprot:s1410_g8.t1
MARSRNFGPRAWQASLPHSAVFQLQRNRDTARLNVAYCPLDIPHPNSSTSRTQSCPKCSLSAILSFALPWSDGCCLRFSPASADKSSECERLNFLIEVSDAEQMDPLAPAHAALALNLAYMQAHGAMIAEGVDGYRAASWCVEHMAWPSHDITFVCWGSPHMELANGSQSREKAGPAACEKARVFDSLRKQFRHSFVMVLFAGHRIDSLHVTPRPGAAEAILALPAFLQPVPEDRTYYPRHSKGSLRTGGAAEVQVLLRVPLSWTGSVPWTHCLETASKPNRDGYMGQVLNIYKLVSLLFDQSGKILFLGEERANLSACLLCTPLHTTAPMMSALLLWIMAKLEEQLQEEYDVYVNGMQLAELLPTSLADVAQVRL